MTPTDTVAGWFGAASAAGVSAVSRVRVSALDLVERVKSTPDLAVKLANAIALAEAAVSAFEALSSDLCAAPLAEKAPARTCHELKTWPEYFVEVLAGNKTFEFRRNDRGFKVGDALWLREWDPIMRAYTGREAFREVTYLLSVGQNPLLVEGSEHVIMAMRPVSEGEARGVRGR